MTVKLSEYIEALTRIHARHGDLDVVRRFPDSDAVHDIRMPTDAQVVRCLYDDYAGDERELGPAGKTVHGRDIDLLQTQEHKRKFVL